MDQLPLSFQGGLFQAAQTEQNLQTIQDLSPDDKQLNRLHTVHDRPQPDDAQA